MMLGAEDGRAAAPGDLRRGEPIHPLIELYRLYERKLFRQCLTQLRNPSDAEDAVQETFARAARHLDQLEEDPAPYLATVARNVCRDEVQRRARCISTGDPAMFGEIEVGHPETSTLDRDELNAAWKRFSRRERELIGRRFAGFSYDEIAGHLDMTPGALNVALARVRKRARQFSSATLAGLLAVLSLRRLLARAGRGGGGTAAMPSALLAATAVTCVVVAGVAGSSWLAVSSGGAPVGAAPSQSSGAPRDLDSHPAAAAVIRPTEGPSTGTGAPSAHSTRSPSAPSASTLASSVISPGKNAQQEDAGFTSITPSPAYQQDHTVFASGTLANGCGRPTCPVIFWTRDAGATWQHLGSNGFLGGKLLLSPGYPADPVMFAASPAGLQRSDDGGATFRTVVPGPAPAAVDPQSQPGALRILVAQQIPMIYDANSGRLTPGPTLPVGITAPTDVAYGPGSAVYFAADQLDPTANAQQDGVIVVCPEGQACRISLVDASDPTLSLASSPGRNSEGALFVWSTTRVMVSRDGGASFSNVGIPGAQLITSLAVALNLSSTPKVVVAEQSGSPGIAQLAESLDGGTSFATLAPSGLAQSMALALAVLPDGHEMAAVAEAPAVIGFGIRCSPDGGHTWSRSC